MTGIKQLLQHCGNDAQDSLNKKAQLPPSVSQRGERGIFLVVGRTLPLLQLEVRAVPVLNELGRLMRKVGWKLTRGKLPQYLNRHLHPS